MSHIDTVKGIIDGQRLFTEQSGPSYVRLMDTPRIWGAPFGKGIMPAALARTREFEQVVSEIVQKAKYRCDLASLNSPDPSWTKVILDAMDMALTTRMKRDRPTQFRFLFGQTPMMLKTGTPPNFIDFQGSLIRLVRARSQFWERMPDIWLGRFFRIQDGVLSGIGAYGKALVGSAIPSGIFGDMAPDDSASTKMTWNHSKIIAVDGTEALVGGHNLNMDLFNSYPPVHDVSVVVHGVAAHHSQMYLNEMWECRSNLLLKEYLDAPESEAPQFRPLSDDNRREGDRRPLDPLTEEGAAAHRAARYKRFGELHGAPSSVGPSTKVSSREEPGQLAASIRDEDLQTLVDLEEPVFEQGMYADSYASLPEYKRATRILSVGKYWTGPNLKTDYKHGSELMKETLINGAQRTLKLSQMDLISAWKSQWQSHVVCHWIMDALLANQNLVVQAVVSPLNAGAGAEGDQYSFGSGAGRTFELFQYYSMYGINDKPRADAAARLHALSRLHIAPFHFTQVAPEQSEEGGSYQWPELDKKGWTQTIRQPSLRARPPKNGVIGDAVEAAKMGSGQFSNYAAVPSAPGNHAKIMIVDDESYVVGSDNLYPGFLSEFNYLVEGAQAVGDLLKSYWGPLWWYSGQHCVNPYCKKGCTAKEGTFSPKKASSRVAPVLRLQAIPDVPLLDRHNAGKVQRIEFGALAQQEMPRTAPVLPKKASSKEELLEAPSSPAPSLPVSAELSQAEKEKRALLSGGMGAFLPDDEPSDLTAPGYYFTESDIYNLQRYYLRNSPNIAVIEGVISFQWEEMNSLAYTTDIHPAITTATDTIVQAFHVGGNHWTLLYITLRPTDDNRFRMAQLLYIDPLNPNAVPVDRLGLLRRPFPGIQAEHSLLRYQNDRSPFGQNSCGAWVVELAHQLSQMPLHRLPDPALNPHEAALALRVNMNRDLVLARAHPRPVAPANPAHWVREPVRQHDDSHVSDVSRPRGLQRSGSLGDLGVRKRSASFGSLPKKK